MSCLRALLDGNEREVVRLRKRVTDVNELETEFEQVSDEGLAEKSAGFKERLRTFSEAIDDAKAVRAEAKEAPEQAAADAAVKAAFDAIENELLEILPEAFAAVREASRRTLKMRHFDVQI